MEKQACDNCSHWKGKEIPLKISQTEEMDSEPTDGWCEKHNKRTDNIYCCDDWEPIK